MHWNQYIGFGLMILAYILTFRDSVVKTKEIERLKARLSKYESDETQKAPN